jgi:hypothetical protein
VRSGDLGRAKWLGPQGELTIDLGGLEVDLMAHPVYGSGEADRELIVEQISTKVDDINGRQIYFNVKNVGSSSIPGYNVGSSVINK